MAIQCAAHSNQEYSKLWETIVLLYKKYPPAQLKTGLECVPRKKQESFTYYKTA